MKSKVIIYITLLGVLALNGYAQPGAVARADKKYERYAYIDAIKTYERIAERVVTKGLTPPRYPAGDGRVKMAAAWLVEQSGMHKGFAMGHVAISRRHALAVVNRGGATANEVIALRDRIQQQVRDSFGIELQTEPVFVGF